MSNIIAPGSSADVNVKVTALTTNPNIPVTYKTIILKKNLVNGVNTLTQAMMNEINTKYIIKYDYILNEDITVPVNCILEFDGGSLSNGTLVGTNTNIKYTTTIFDNINISGTWNIPVIKSSMFKDIQEIDKINSLFSLCNDSLKNEVIIENGEYYVTPKWNEAIHVGIGLDIHVSNVNVLNQGTIKIVNNELPSYNVVRIHNCLNTIFRGGYIIGDKESHDYSQHDGTHEWGHGICVYDCDNIKICNVDISLCIGDGIAFSEINNITIEDVNISLCRRQGISVLEMNKNVFIKNFIIHDINGTAPQSGIDIEPSNSDINTNIIIQNGIIKNCIGSAITVTKPNKIDDSENIVIENIRTSNNNLRDLYVGNSSNVNIKNYFSEDGGFEFYHCSVSLSNCVFSKTYDVGENSNFENKCRIDTSEVFAENSIFNGFRSEYDSNNDSIFTNCKIILSNLSYPTISGKYYNCEISTGIASTAIMCQDNIHIKNSKIKFLKNANLPQGLLFMKNFVIEDITFYANDNLTVVISNLVGLYDISAVDKIKSKVINIYVKNVSFTNIANTLLGNGIACFNNVARFSLGEINIPSNDRRFIGASYYKEDIKKKVTWNGSKIIEYDNATAGVKRFGTWTDKPSSTDIYVGFRYFCTDKQTAEGATNGIEIIHKGNDVWVDALGRVIL